MSTANEQRPLERLVRCIDISGNEVEQCCGNCEHIYDDSDGPEYGLPWPKCSKKPHMGHLKGFPFKTAQKCFEMAWYFSVDWNAESKKLNAPNAGIQAAPKASRLE